MGPGLADCLSLGGQARRESPACVREEAAAPNLLVPYDNLILSGSRLLLAEVLREPRSLPWQCRRRRAPAGFLEKG